MTKEIAELDELLEYAESAMADGYPYEVIDGSLALTVKALRAYRASLEPPASTGEWHHALCDAHSGGACDCGGGASLKTEAYPRCACGAYEWGTNTTRITDVNGQEHYREKCATQVNRGGSL